MFWRAIIVGGICLELCAQPMQAQSPVKPEMLTIPALQKRIKSTQDNSELADGAKEKAVGLLQEAIDRLEIAQENLETAEKFERRLTLVQESLQSTERRLADLPSAADPDIATIENLQELGSMVDSRQKELDDAQNGIRKQIADLDAEAARMRSRPEELVNELSEIEDRLHEISDELDELATFGEPREVMQARQLFLAARRRRAESERMALQAESAWSRSPTVTSLLQAQQELAAKTLVLKVAELELLENELGKRRGDEADQRVHQAEAVVARVAAILKPLAEQNLALAREQREVTNKLREVEQRHETTSASLTELQKEFDRTQKMVDEVGLTDTIGLLLRQQRAKLQDRRTLRSNSFRRNDVVRETRMRLFQLESDRAALIDLDAAIVKHAAELDSAIKQNSVPTEIRSLLVEQRQLNNGLENTYAKYFTQLIEMDVLERKLLEITTKYANYVDERVLWIRTGPLFGRDHLAKFTASLMWFLDSKLWQPVVDATLHNVHRQPIPWAVGSMMFVFWLGLIPLLIGQIRHRGAIATQPDCRDLWPTLQTICLTFALASGWPALLWFLGSRLDHSVSVIPFVHAVAAGLERAAMFAFPLEVLRIVCLRGGLAERHFDWPRQSVEGWRRNLNWFIPIGVVLIGVVGLMEATADERRVDSFSRAIFLAFAAISAVFSQLTFRQTRDNSKVNHSVVTSDTDVWSIRFWRFAPFLATAACLGLFLAAWAGYYYTALQLTWRFQNTAWFAVGLLIVRAVVRRWIALERRRMAVLQDAELRTIAEAGHEPGNASQHTFLFPRWNWPDFRLNLTQIVTQMRQLLDTGLMALAVVGLWLVWTDVTPALNILDRFTLWHTTTTVTETVTSEDENHVTSVKPVTRSIRVTVQDLGFACLIVAIVAIACRNVPGLVEVILLEHLSVDAGIRFATTCLVRYAIFTAGVCLAFAQIGIGWSNVQWLVAAASVGLGFGLQEIFGNFVSGIILLFERPMRVGDVVTVGDTTGTVSRIRFRATTIVDGDRKELIVPNKEFITGHLLNWTLSDRINRVAVKVVVAGNNDPQRVRRLLLEIASQQPNLLKDPAPSATLDDVNGGLTFSLRGFLPTLEGRATAIQDLYTVIDIRFKAEGIELSCPTQEVFVRMKTHDAHSLAPTGPHQSPVGVPIKPMPMDLSAAFRRA